MTSRISWDKYFLDLARLTSKRSHDIHTQHGCVLVKDKKVIGVGYNGFARDLIDENLPLNRPDKYPFMLHSEINALLNRTINEKEFTAYITGEPCFNCMYMLYQAGCNRIVYEKGYSSKLINEDDKKNKELLLNNIKRDFKIELLSS